MLASKLKLITLFVSMTAIFYCAWANHLNTFTHQNFERSIPNLDTIATQRVDDGFKRAIFSFGTARVLGAVISFAQGTEVSVEPVGVGMKFAPGQLLHPIGDVVDKFADLMLAATVIFGAMKVLLIIGANIWSSLAVTGVTLYWIWHYWKGRPSPLWLSRLAVILMLVRFSVPVVMVGSDAVFQQFMADEYNSSQSVLSTTAGELKSSPVSQEASNPEAGIWNRLKTWVSTNLDVAARIKALREGATKLVEHIIKVIVVFLLQTLVIPLLFFWALIRVFTAMFQNPVASLHNKNDGAGTIDI